MMQKTEDLNEKWNEFDLTKDPHDFEKLVHATASYIFFHFHYITGKPSSVAGHLNGVKEDHKSDFILYIYPQLKRIIEQFNPQKASFITYVTIISRFKYKKFCREQKNACGIQEAAENEEKTLWILHNMEKFQKEAVCEDTSSPDYIETADEHPGYGRRQASAPPYVFFQNQDRVAFSGKGFAQYLKKHKSRIVLLLALKSAFDISTEMIEKTAESCGMSSGELWNLIEIIRHDYGKHQERFETMKAQYYKYYIRTVVCKQHLKKLAAECTHNSPEIKTLERKNEFCERQKRRLKMKMQSVRRTPSNRYLAALLNIPRGTVDSTLVRLKKELYAGG